MVFEIVKYSSYWERSKNYEFVLHYNKLLFITNSLQIELQLNKKIALKILKMALLTPTVHCQVVPVIQMFKSHSFDVAGLY